MSDENKIAKQLHSAAIAGDRAAWLELRKMAWASLAMTLAKMTLGLCSPENLLNAATGQPHAPGTIGDVASKAMDAAILKWNGIGNWIQFATSFVVAALWDAVTLATGLPKREFRADMPAGARSPMAFSAKLMPERRAELGQLIRSTAVSAWADEHRTRRGWLLLLRKLGDALLCALVAVLVAAGIDWNQAWSVEKEIRRMARSKAKRDGRYENKQLALELFTAAMTAIAFACRTYDPSRRFLPFAGKVAHHAMIGILDPVRSDDDHASWLRVLAAEDDLRDRLKKEPEIEEIVIYLNAKSAAQLPKDKTGADGVTTDSDAQSVSGEPAKGKYSVIFVRSLMVVFGSDLAREMRRKAREIADGSAMATSGAEAPSTAEEPGLPSDSESREEIFNRAGLSPLERQVVELRECDLTHPEIGALLGITAKESRDIFWEAIDKLEAVGKLITAKESQVLQGKFIAWKSDSQIAEELGVETSKIEVLLDRARWKLRVYPDLRVELTDPEWSALNLALTGMSCEQIAFHTDRPPPDVASLLQHAVRTVSPHNRGNNTMKR